jgi:hypothetical protein
MPQRQMKKFFVLFTLFIVPIVAYLFFASGVNGFTHLPILTPKVSDFGNWNSLTGEKVSLDKKITVLGFGGNDILKNRGNMFNLQQKVYLRYHEFTDLQFVYVCPIGTEEEAKSILTAMEATTDMSRWKFIFATPEQILVFHSGLKLKANLETDLGSPNVYIIDKERNLRGRKDKQEYKEGYDTFHPAEISNEMLDDFKVVLYEYRAALKKNNNATKKTLEV